MGAKLRKHPLYDGENKLKKSIFFQDLFVMASKAESKLQKETTEQVFEKNRSDDKEHQEEDDDIIIPPDGGFGWVVLIACFVSN
jgi:hypothetical protein